MVNMAKKVKALIDDAAAPEISRVDSEDALMHEVQTEKQKIKERLNKVSPDDVKGLPELKELVLEIHRLVTK